MSEEPVAAVVTFPFGLYQTSVFEVKFYQDMMSTDSDLEYCRQFITESVLRSESEEQPHVKAALFSASHITYRRCFNRGKFGLGNSDLSVLSEEQRQIHNYHLTQANKLIAHSVNRYESVYAGIAIQDGRAGLGHIGVRLFALPKEDAEKWLALVVFIKTEVLTPKIEKARKLAIERINKIPLDEIHRAGKVEIPIATKSTAHKAR